MPEYNYVAATGVIVPDTSTLQGDVNAEFRTAFGADLRMSPDTPQGVLGTAETLARDSVVQNNAQIANQINPDLAGGVFLDALCALLGLYRQPATRTVVTGVQLTGRPNTLIPQGVRVRSNAGDLFQTAGAYILSSTGQATAALIGVETGPLPAAANTIVTIIDPVLGWEGVNNPTDGVPGTDEQSDASLRAQRRRTLALQGISTPEAIMSEVANVPDVRSLQFRENILSTVQVIDGITMAPHSVWVCVDGGLDSAVALALLTNKTAGAAWNGETTVVVTEPSSGQNYSVQFDRPADVQILVRVTIRPSGATADPQQVIPAAIVAYANGQIDGEQGFFVGGPVSPFELAGAINRTAPGIHVVRVEVARATDGIFQSTELPISLLEVARVVTSSVTVTLG